MNKVKLIITIALKAELPLEWLHSLGVFVCDMRRPDAMPDISAKSGVLILVTGVGREASERAAFFIGRNFKPLCVLNLGTAGSFMEGKTQHTWVLPESLCDIQGHLLSNDTRLPFPWPPSLPMPVKIESLISVEKPVLNKNSRPESKAKIVDMESFYQAEKFLELGIPFHVLKWLSDGADQRTEEEFHMALERFTEEMKTVLAFLKGPGKADVSVVIPVHERPGRIIPCIDSVLSQTLRPREIIVVDDGSRDGTWDVLQGFSDRLKLIRFSENLGVSAARNAGIRQSSSEWVSFLDSDDVWTRDKLEKQWAFLVENPFFEILQSKEIWMRHGVRVNPCNRHLKPEGWIWEKCLKRCYITPSSVLMKRDLFGRFGFFDEALPSCEDFDLWLRMAREKIVGLESGRSLMRFGGHEDQLSTRYPAMDWFRVRSLMKVLASETDESFSTKIRSSLLWRLEIIKKGGVKRGNSVLVNCLEELVSAVRCHDRGEFFRIEGENGDSIYSHILN